MQQEYDDSRQGVFGRRAFLGGVTASALVALTACQSLPPLSLTEAIRRMLLLSSERAFARLTAPGGFWDDQVAEIGLGNILGTRGDVLSGILTSSLFKDRLEDAFAEVAIEGSYRAAPVVTDAVRTIGIANAVALVNGGPRAATGFLRDRMANSLIEVMVPELGEALRISREPLVGQALSALAGVDVSRVADSFAQRIDTAIWNEIGYEEELIRENPAATNDPVITGVFGASRL
ncbi:DUF4197 family protein [Altererythrobacter aurantiacus]|uniref:DUF4197 family protein n=1 Tax=Parapontixanthobacter aurantiacus TaxID=1463599 RepID=A0A844ZDV9_9SPHN|nr:DUF4197 domain-containing protein [Parapontixanthobacter aurantiacus]MXO85714.1 DUF4197 family protein [Parapontixanthobacter aurantiacus]